MTSKGLRVKMGTSLELIAKHQGKDLTFVSPKINRDYFLEVRRQLDRKGLRMPTMVQTASILYAAWQNPNNKSSKEVIKKLGSDWLFGNNVLLYVPSKGVYVVDNPLVVDERSYSDEAILAKRLKDGDNAVRFVPFGYELQGQTSLQLAKNPFVRALAGEDGAEKLAQVSDKFITKPAVQSFMNVDEPTIIFPRLGYPNYYFGDNGLYVDGRGLDDYKGYAFGILKSRGMK